MYYIEIICWTYVQGVNCRGLGGSDAPFCTARPSHFSVRKISGGSASDPPTSIYTSLLKTIVEISTKKVVQDLHPRVVKITTQSKGCFNSTLHIKWKIPLELGIFQLI